MSHPLRTTNVFQMDHRRYFSLCPVSQKLVKSVDYLLLMEQQCVSKRANCWCIFKTCSETKCIYHHCIWTAVNICGTKPDFSTVGFVCVGFFCLGNPGLKWCRIEKMNIVGCYLNKPGKSSVFQSTAIWNSVLQLQYQHLPLGGLSAPGWRTTPCMAQRAFT